MSSNQIKINRAPVMTLWAAVVAERLGYDPQAALTLGKSVAGLNAQSKGQRLGIYEASEGKEAETKPQKERAPGEQTTVSLLGRSVPAVYSKDGLRAVSQDKPWTRSACSDIWIRNLATTWGMCALLWKPWRNR